MKDTRVYRHPNCFEICGGLSITRKAKYNNKIYEFFVDDVHNWIKMLKIAIIATGESESNSNDETSYLSRDEIDAANKTFLGG